MLSKQCYKLMCLIAILECLWMNVYAAAGIISADMFSPCGPQVSNVQISGFSFLFQKSDKHFEFRISGTSTVTSNVTLRIKINAYGIDAYAKELDPCSQDYRMESLCPLHEGAFEATGKVTVPEKVLRDLPAIVFNIPDLQGFVTMDIVTNKSDALTCIRAPVTNGESLASSTAKAVTGTVAAGALVVSGAVSVAASMSASGAAVGAGSVGGTTPNVISTSPNVGDVLFWFQAMGLNGALSVVYPSICNSFYHNFGWAIGLVQWRSMQVSIDSFRKSTGGHLSSSSVKVLDSSHLVQASHSSAPHTITKRGDITNETHNTTMNHGQAKIDRVVSGLQAFAEQLKIPSQNTFMTVLVLFLILTAITLALSVITKFILDLLSRFYRLPSFLNNFRLHYWSSIVSLLLRSILVIYGTWCIFCLYQFKQGDSWAASLLAGVSLALFTSIIAFLAIRIIHIAAHDEAHGEKGRDRLYKHKPYLQKYGILYDQFQAGTWWFFIPCLLYSVIKSCFIALADGHGFIQVIGCMACEAVLLTFLLSTRAYESRQANIVNVLISVVRIVSLTGTLLFVDILELKETTKTVAGIAMIVLQSATTLLLAILVICNGLMPLFAKKKSQGSPDNEHLISDETPPGVNEKTVSGDYSESSLTLHRRSTSVPLIGAESGGVDDVVVEAHRDGSDRLHEDKNITYNSAQVNDEEEPRLSKDLMIHEATTPLLKHTDSYTKAE